MLGFEEPLVPIGGEPTPAENAALAAALVLLSFWKRDRLLVDPMCGSGTFLIEAGLMACKIPPGKLRSFYGFQKWKDYDSELQVPKIYFLHKGNG